MENLEIGTKVKWTVSNKTRKGIFKQAQGDKAEVITTFIENQRITVKTFVPLYLIEVDN